jgi:hypothetical protein
MTTTNRAPFPDQLPGEFFVIMYDRDRERYILHTDDAERSSYELPLMMPQILFLLRKWNVSKIGERAVDMAREFGMAQAILGTDRVVAIYKKADAEAFLKFEDGQEVTGGMVQLPRLQQPIG